LLIELFPKKSTVLDGSSQFPSHGGVAGASLWGGFFWDGIWQRWGSICQVIYVPLWYNNAMQTDGLVMVRDYRAEDYEAVARIWLETGVSTPGRGDTAESIRQTLANHGRFLVLAECKRGCVIGTSWLTNDGRRLYLHHLAIATAFQGRGYSKLLLTEILKIARTMGMQIKLEVSQINEKAINLYRKAGFKRLGDYDVYIIRDWSQVSL
jgi:ribosomal protein S18 acetylase RimI-like enzyme